MRSLTNRLETIDAPRIVVQASASAVTLCSFGSYSDGLERLSAPEANLWAVAILPGGVSAAFTGSIVVPGVTLLALLRYAVRTRFPRRTKAITE